MAGVVLSDLSKVFPGGAVAADHVDITIAEPADGSKVPAGR